MQLPLTGACQCRKVRYRIDRAPMGVWACHCTECQRQSGSAFALTMVVPRQAITVSFVAAIALALAVQWTLRSRLA